MIEIIFVQLATHLRFYVGTLDCQIAIIYFYNLNLKSESTDNSLTNG
jgi:hypothetical protein